jgi:hypothetical protein
MRVVSLAKGRAIVSDFRWRASQHAPKGPVHVALVAEACFLRDVCARVVRLAQCMCRALDAEAGGSFHRSFAGSLPISGSEPGRVAPHVAGEIGYSKRRVIAELLTNHLYPARRLAHGLGVGTLHESPESSTKMLFVHSRYAAARQCAGRGASLSAKPPGDGFCRHQLASQPSRVELDLNLLEAEGPNGVAMRGPRLVKDCRGARDLGPTQFGLVDIAA